MPKIKGFNSEDRYNFLLALVGYLGHRDQVSLVEVAEHFELETEYVAKALKSLNEATAQVGVSRSGRFMSILTFSTMAKFR